jgi:hypothetical protein
MYFNRQYLFHSLLITSAAHILSRLLLPLSPYLYDPIIILFASIHISLTSPTPLTSQLAMYTLTLFQVYLRFVLHMDANDAFIVAILAGPCITPLIHSAINSRLAARMCELPADIYESLVYSWHFVSVFLRALSCAWAGDT